MSYDRCSQSHSDSVQLTMRLHSLTDPLPFDDNSFELVRVSCLSLCIASRSWPFILQEIFRVLMVGGRLELIDDLVFFPYGKTFSLSEESLSSTSTELPPRLDVGTASNRFTTYNVCDRDFRNPGLGEDAETVDHSDVHNLYGVEEEPEDDDDATLFGHTDRMSGDAFIGSKSPHLHATDVRTSNKRSAAWERSRTTAVDLEAVFDHMLVNKFGIAKDPHTFLTEMMQNLFGHAKLLKTLHITIPPSKSRRSSKRSSKESTSHPGPGLILWPSTFIPMEQAEVDLHASKNLRLLLATKNFLVEHALEATNDDEIDEGTVLDALTEYERSVFGHFDLLFF